MAYLWSVDLADVSGNTLVAGCWGFLVYNACTNAVLLCNDFSSATNSSIRDVGMHGDLLNAVIVKNKLSSGVKTTTAHLESATVEDGPHYFLLYNQYVNGDGQPNTLLLDPANLPVHVVP